MTIIGRSHPRQPCAHDILTLLPLGIIAAVIAFLIIRAEMALFDVKEGFCSTSWGTAKRFCCAPHHRGRAGAGEKACGDWVDWGEFFNPRETNGPEGAWIWGGSEFVAYSIVAVSAIVIHGIPLSQDSLRSRLSRRV